MMSLAVSVEHGVGLLSQDGVKEGRTAKEAERIVDDVRWRNQKIVKGSCNPDVQMLPVICASHGAIVPTESEV